MVMVTREGMVMVTRKGMVMVTRKGMVMVTCYLRDGSVMTLYLIFRRGVF